MTVMLNHKILDKHELITHDSVQHHNKIAYDSDNNPLNINYT